MPKQNYGCAVDGLVNHQIINGIKIAGICGKVKVGGGCGAHGNKKCPHKIKIETNVNEELIEEEAQKLSSQHMSLDFGDYCCIEQKRYGVENEIYKYKVIGRGRANYYRTVPVDAKQRENQRGEICDVVKVICCGVREEKVETFRLQDVMPNISKVGSTHNHKPTG